MYKKEDVKIMKIAFLGSDRIAIPCLEALLQSEVFCEICGVLTQPDRRSGRGQKFQPNPVKKWSCDRGIPLIEPDHLGTQEIYC